MDLDDLFAGHGGVMSSAELTAAGVPRGRVEALLRDGRLLSLRRGLLSTPAALEHPLGLARACGASVTCVTALEAHGAWTPARADRARVHLAMTRSQHESWRTRSLPAEIRSRVLVHRRSDALTRHLARGSWVVDPPAVAALATARCCDVDELFAVLERAVMRGTPRAELESLSAFAGAKFRTALAALSPPYLSGSGVESLVKFRLRQLRLVFRQQVQIGDYRVDFLIGRRMVLEVDGLAYHGDRTQFRTDRERDRYLQSRGYLVLRFTADEVLWNWPWCEAEIMRFVRSRQHERPTR